VRAGAHNHKIGLAFALSLFAVQCDRRAASAGNSPAENDAHPAMESASPDGRVAVDAARMITSIASSAASTSGDASLRCTPDGTVSETFFNPGFSSAGAEVVQRNKTLAPAEVAELWATAQAVVLALPDAREAPDASWKLRDSIEIVLSDGARLSFSWSGDGTHPDSRVQRIAALLLKAK
jgi:hypothetical protein